MGGITMFDENRQIAIIWSIEDVQSVRPDLNDEQCMDVLQEVQRKHDANLGITWDTLKIHADYMFPNEVEMTPQEYNILYKFFDEDNGFIVASDKVGEMPPYCYMWDNYHNNPNFNALKERTSLPADNPCKLYIYTLTEEDGIGTITDGWHYVNRVGYFFSTKDIKVPVEGIRYW